MSCMPAWLAWGKVATPTRGSQNAERLRLGAADRERPEFEIAIRSHRDMRQRMKCEAALGIRLGQERRGATRGSGKHGARGWKSRGWSDGRHRPEQHEHGKRRRQREAGTRNAAPESQAFPKSFAALDGATGQPRAGQVTARSAATGRVVARPGTPVSPRGSAEFPRRRLRNSSRHRFPARLATAARSASSSVPRTYSAARRSSSSATPLMARGTA